MKNIKDKSQKSLNIINFKIFTLKIIQFSYLVKITVDDFKSKIFSINKISRCI